MVLKHNKRGVSPIIATVMLIMLTIAAVGIIAGFLIPFVKKSLSDSTVCFSYRNYFEFEDKFGYNCYSSDGVNYLHAVSVKSGSDTSKEANIKGFELVFSEMGSSTKKSAVNGASASSEIGGLRMLDETKDEIAVPQAGEMRTYVFNGGSNVYKGVEVYPVLQTGKVCEASDKVDLKICKTDLAIE